MTTSKIAVFGFGSMPVVQRHLMDLARANDTAIAWCTILTQPNYRTIMREVLPAADILDVFTALPVRPEGGALDQLGAYRGSLIEDAAAQKRRWRPRPGQWLLDRAIDYYRIYKAFLKDRGATHLLTSNIETPDGKIAIAAARELGIGVLAPVDLRNLTGMILAADAGETPPAHARATTETRARAEAFIRRFRDEGWTPARAAPSEIDPARDDTAIMAQHLPPFRQRLAGFARVAMERPDLFDPVYLRDSMMSNSRLLQRLIWGTRERINAPKFHVAEARSLPERFVFYPLQYTPESSINTPAPYFVDQFRAIDAIRFAMPASHVLVVKEHRACLPLRPTRFMHALMRLPGVVVAASTMPARTLVEKAGVTISVTGTAVMEARLAGCSALALGPSISAWVAGGTVGIGDLGRAIRRSIDQPPDDRELTERVAALLSVRYPVLWGTPHMAGEPILRRGNMRRLLAAILDHLERDRTARPVPAPAVGA